LFSKNITQEIGSVLKSMAVAWLLTPASSPSLLPLDMMDEHDMVFVVL
jgi:hypothetical protein